MDINDRIKKLKLSLDNLIDKDIRKMGLNNLEYLDSVLVSNDYSNGFFYIRGDIKDKVYDEDIYNPQILIDLRSNEIVDIDCECDDYCSESEEGDVVACAHIEETLNEYLELLKVGKIEYPNIENIIKETKYNNAKELLDILSKDEEVKKELINIEISLSKSSYHTIEVSFKVGQGKLYVLKNINDFIEAMESDKELVFGKGFIYNPRIHKFSDEDKKIIDFIKEYVSVSNILSENNNNGYYGFYRPRVSSLKLVKNKAISITGTGLKRFLSLAEYKEINVDFDNYKGKSKVIIGEIPFQFNLKEYNDEIILENKGVIPKLLIPGEDVFLFNENLYITEESQGSKYRSFINAFSQSDEIIFKNQDSEKVFTKIIPIIKSISKEVVIDKTIKEKIEVGELKIEFYFDRDRNKTWCKVKKSYGEEKFDAIEGYKGDKYIIRDIEKEKEVDEKLREFKFYTNKDIFEFTGSDEELYGFLSKYIDSFKELGEVYYSDKFKEQKIYRSQSINAGIKERENYLEFTFNIGDIESSEFNNILKAFKDNRKFYKLKDNSFINLEDKETRDFLQLLDNIVGEKKIKNDIIEISRNKAIYINENIKENNLRFIKGSESLDSISKSFKTLDEVNFDIPKGLKTTLRDYQVTGFNWFKTVSHYGFGGILADEMGLGKTVQTIAFLLSEKDKKTLIVTPTSLIYNWQREFEKFAPNMKVAIIHGSKEQRLNILNNEDRHDVIITTYGTLKNDFDYYKNKSFNYCIIDEGQNIKNPLAQSTELVKEIKAEVKFALTGTPIENNLMELWSIFDFIMPGYLYNKKKFQDKFISTKNEVDILELKKLINPFILRRLKVNVIEELPDKIEKKFFVDMTEEQKKVYSTYIKDIQEKMDSEDLSKDKITVFSYLTKLRQLCLDPAIIIDGYNGGSSKIDTALDILKENIQNGNKILLFSQFTSVLANLKSILDSEKIKYYYLDGSTKASNRINLVNNFNNDEDIKIFLISLKAGGTGLNLTSASVVIHFDPWWNPAIEDQATDRAHRIGQKKVVEVIKLIAQGTVEEKIINLQESKKELINNIMEGKFEEGSFLKNLNEEELKNLFK